MKGIESINAIRKKVSACYNVHAVYKNVPVYGSPSIEIGRFDALFGHHYFNFLCINTSGEHETLTLSSDRRETIKKKLSLMRVLDKKTSDTWRELTVNDGPLPKLETLNNDVASIYRLVKLVFNDDFLDEKDINSDYLKTLISGKRGEWNEFKTAKFSKPIPVVRIEEIRSNLRILLMINPISLKLKLCYTHLEEAGIRSQVHHFFNNELDGYLLPALMKKDEIKFIEYQGHPQYPLAYNNKQKCEIVHNMYDEGNIVDVIKRSGQRQRRYLNKLIDMCFLCFGEDAFGEGRITKGHKDFIDEGLIKHYNGLRVYPQSDFDLVLAYTSTKVIDDHGNPFFVFASNLIYTPFVRNKGEKTAWYWHPNIYEAGK